MAQIKLDAIRRMLNECAPGHDWVEKDHRIHVTYNGKAYRTLPTARHTSKGHVQRPHVKKLVRKLGIEDCAKARIPALAN